MNPLKVLWFHMRARVRLFHIWMVVQLGLHRKAPTRIRSKLVKVADWLEATVLTSSSVDANREDKTRNAIIETYKALQEEMAKIQQKDRLSINKEDIETIKGSFLYLLDLCSIKDADIPPLNEPVPLRHTTQTLITSFGIMSKSLSGGSAMTTPPPRSRRHVRRDPASYADMLIEQLMANASPDSDTSPPSAENNNDSNVQSLQQQEEMSSSSSHVQPMTLRFESPGNPSSSSSSSSSPPPNLPPPQQHLPLSPASDARCGGWAEEEENLALPNHPHSHPLHVRPTSDSGITVSGSSHTIASSNTMSPPIQGDTLNASKSSQNATSGSTPELPAVVAASSQTLDIPFASFFGKFDKMNSLSDNKPAIPEKTCVATSSKTNIPPPQSSQTATASQQNCYNFPLKYSHSYARELQRLEAEMFSDLQLEPDVIPSPKRIPRNVDSKSSKEVDSHFVFHEPLVVVLPEKGLSKEKIYEKHNYNSNNNYKPCLEDKSGVVETEDTSPKPPIPPRVPLTNTKNTKTNKQLGQFVVASEQTKNVASVWMPHKTGESSSADSDSPCNMSWSYTDSPPHQVPANSLVGSMSTGKAHVREKKKGPASAFAHHHPVSPLRPSSHTTTSASKRRKANDKSPLPVEHKSTTTHQPRSARQRLFLSPTRTNSPLRHSFGYVDLGTSPASPGNPMTPRMDRMRRVKRHSPAMRRLMQQKENNLLSPSKNQTSPRKPFGELYNIQLNESDPLTTSSNSLSPSSENYAKSSETSPDMPLPSREEEILDRNAYYEDFTVDRDHKLGQLTPQQKNGLLKKSTQNNLYTLTDPSNNEILVRQVEGAESSPKKSVFQAPLPNTRAPRSTRIKRQGSRRQLVHQHSSSSSSSRNGNKYDIRKPKDSKKRVSSVKRPSSTSCSSHPMASSTMIMDPYLRSPENEKDDETASVYTWSIEEGSETCNLERSFLRSQSERKNNKKVSNNNNNNNPCISRPPTNVGCDSSDISQFEEMGDDKSSFEITAMVSAIDRSLNTSSALSGQQIDSFCDDFNKTPVASKPVQKAVSVQNSLPRTSTRGTIPGRGIVTAAPNLINKITKSSGSNPNHSGGSSSGPSSNSSPSSANKGSGSSSSGPFNKAKGSIQSIPSSSSDDQNKPATSTATKNNNNNIHNNNNNIHSNPMKVLSASAPDLIRACFNEDEDASHSLQPSDTDSTPEILSCIMDERSDIPGKSNSSESSSCTAARCRPRVIPPQATAAASWTELSKADSESTPTLPSQRQQHSDQQQQQQATSSHAQDLMDSILTDSPKSVDSSGIFAPYNSYNSPAESVGSHNGYSSTVSSSVPSSDSYYPVRIVQYPASPASPLLVDSPKYPPPPEFASEDSGIFKRPFSPAPHINRSARAPVTRSQGVTATASCSSTPTRPMSVRSDPLATKSIFAVPPGVVTGPPKIVNKKSIVKKLKKFSSNFYKKNEKIQTLANL